MCFSASASFGASLFLITIGIALRRATSSHNPLRSLAHIPFIFALQQAAEGFVWLSLTQSSFAQWYAPATSFFLICAFMIWPWYIPSTLARVEPNPQRHSFLQVFTACGLLFAGSALFSLMYYGSYANTTNGHIYYQISIPYDINIPATILYLLATITPFFISSVPCIKFVGFLMGFSYGISYIFYKMNLVSIWCFFAALISGAIFLLLYHAEKRLK